MSKNIRLSYDDMMKYEIVAFMGQTPLEVAQSLMKNKQVVFNCELLKEWLVVCPMPNSSNFLVRYQSNGQIFKNPAEASLCFVSILEDYIVNETFGTDYQDN
tara:strand:+ start:321 stop:626 length:306 start_codon:yes stop_codon:yes gene_type:complete